MAPRRSGRRNVSAYKKGDYIEYQYKGSTVTGKLQKKSPKGTADRPVWVVTPSDRRRKNEEIPERSLGKIIDEQEASNNRGPKLKRGSAGGGGGMRLSQASSNSNSDDNGSLPADDDAIAKHDKKRDSNNRGSSSEENSKLSSSARKRKGGGEGGIGNNGNKGRKTVTFSQESNGSGGAATSSSSIRKKKKASSSSKKGRVHKKGSGSRAKAPSSSTRIGTRSTRGNGEIIAPMYLPELPMRRKKLYKTKRVKKDENVTVVKMLTGTLYLYRGDRPRAEFVRTR